MCGSGQWGSREGPTLWGTMVMETVVGSSSRSSLTPMNPVGMKALVC